MVHYVNINTIMKKFLVLGIGNAQVDLLEKLFNRFLVYALSRNSYGRGLRYANTFSLIDIIDKEAVFAYAENEKIDYIYSVGSDLAMPTVSYVAEKLGLPSLVNYTSAITCNNKADLRKQLRDTYGAVQFEILTNQNKKTNIPFPAIIKPIDSQGQRGVQTIMSRYDIPKAYDIAIKYSKIGKVILEEKIEGQEFSINCYLVNGLIRFFLPSLRKTWSHYDGGIVHSHCLPAPLSEQATINIRRLVEETTAQLGIMNGPVYLQIIVNEDRPYLIEVTPRLDGCHMWRFIKYSTGVDLIECAISHLQGLPVKLPNEFNLTAGMLEFFCQPPGEPFVIAKTHPDAQYIEWFYAPGQIVQTLNGRMEKCGYQIVIEDNIR
jgi:formate-dependent phosphoribosylglycinamide formyltransferase (GAR transformylase)